MIINCDLGEGCANDKELFPFIDAANIACGFHAGDEETMRRSLAYCIDHKVSIGAHPSFYDRDNFGRTELNLPAADIYALVREQLHILDTIAGDVSENIKHVKPHGALYNMSAKNKEIAKAIATATKDHNPSLVLFGLSGSYSISEAEAMGLNVANEVFADRTYQDDGSLTSRKEYNGMIFEKTELAKQVKQMAEAGSVTSISGKVIKVKADTICIHGDGPNAVEFAKLVHEILHGNP